MARWTQEEVNFLKREYPTKPYDEIGQALDRTVSSIRSKAQDLGLRKIKQQINLELDTITPDKQRVIDEIANTKYIRDKTSREMYVCSNCGISKRGKMFTFSNRELARFSTCTQCKSIKNGKYKTNRIIEGRDW